MTIVDVTKLRNSISSISYLMQASMEETKYHAIQIMFNNQPRKSFNEMLDILGWINDSVCSQIKVPVNQNIIGYYEREKK